MPEQVIQHLRALVGFATPNPPREIGTEHPLFAYVRGALGPDFDVTISDHGAGCISMLATRGAPRTLFNFHVDTVPAPAGYSADPWELQVVDGRAIGLGACDIKGACAAMLTALGRDAKSPVALLLTSDEEHGNSTCVRTFCGRELDFDLVVVAEPTELQAVTEHRGIVTGTATFRGVPGHASSGNADRDSAVHHAVRWSAAALDLAAGRDVRLNLGRIEGGHKPNMIAEHAEIRFGCRPLPGVDGVAFFDELATLVTDDSDYQRGFVAPSLPAPGQSAETARRWAADFGLTAGAPVDFWTEAALFSAAGYPTFVFGPGSIAQAHTIDEWVAVDQLVEAAACYGRILEAGR